METSSRKQPNILLIDDLPENLKFLRYILAKLGYKVRIAISGELALNSAENDPPDLILLDLLMPEMDGFEVCRQLKLNPKTKKIPVIFLTGSNEVENKIRAFNSGGVDFITKPFNKQEIIARVQTHIRLHDYQSRLEKQNIQLKQEIESHKQTEGKLRLANDNLQKAMIEAEHASRAKSEFLSNMSHELRTPMNSVLGFLMFSLEDPELARDHQINIKTAYDSANELMRLINDILDVNQLENGKMVLVEQPFDLSKLLKELIKDFNKKANSKGLEFIVNIHDNISGVYTGDAGRVKQIINNLLDNAVKFTEKGWIKLSLKPWKKDNFLHFTISDSGIGIAPERLDFIFDIFTQADGSSTRKYGGTGLGTAIAKQLSQLMGGKIWVKSMPGKGSKFQFIIKLKPLYADINEIITFG